ncbi:hypothetical protein E2C01_043736 [Portunus trituberculatus]|uniref:Uncharacterized protein n=1 Tax=Portunus trituberculatus TaxID=210409 RepID=A0A5B7FR16_PORTR|nr:hypothetical protein [Portunus trituberculatus]
MLNSCYMERYCPRPWLVTGALQRPRLGWSGS